MSRGIGPQPFGQTAASLGANDPRHRRNNQGQLTPDFVYEPPLRVNQNQRVAIELGAFLTTDGNNKLTIDVPALKAALGL